MSDTITIITILYFILIIPIIPLYRVMNNHKLAEIRTREEQGDEEEEKSLM